MTDHPDIQLDKSDSPEAGLELPFDRIPPATLRNMLADYVSRDWSELTDAGFSLDDKIAQVYQQLSDGQARILYDLTTETWNIVPAEQLTSGERNRDGQPD